MKKIVLLVVIFSLQSVLFGQENSYNYNIDLYPKSPEAYAFAKFVDIPAGSFTGVANFSIPIYSIEVDGLKIPIQLDYATTGVKVDEIASRVGLGWNLNAGPSLSVQTLGSKDGNTRIKIDPNTFFPNDDNTHSHDKIIADEIAKGEYDAKPDLFSYSLPTSSGKFIMDASGINAIPIPYEPIVVNNEGAKIIIKDDNGNTYYFHLSMNTLNYNSCATNVLSDKSNYTYYLDKIITKNGKVIQYTYDHSVSTFYATGFSEQKEIDYMRGYPDDIPPPVNPFCLYYSYSNEPILKSVIFGNNNIIEFNYNIHKSKRVREDLPGEVFLEQIIVKENNNIIKNYAINNTYFIGDTSYIKPYQFERLFTVYGANLKNGIDKRLKLSNVLESLSGSEYKLEYYENKKLPPRFSFAQDYWGVFNGKNNQASSLAQTLIFNFQGQPKLYGNADKSPNIEYGIIGNLKKITYPTDGFLEIEYEADQHWQKDSYQITYGEASFTYNTRDSQTYINVEIPNQDVSNIYYQFTGDNDDGTSHEAVGNCKLLLIDQSTGNNILTNPYEYTSTFGSNGIPLNSNLLLGKKLRMSIEKGYDHWNESEVNCYATLNWIQENRKMVPAHNESIGTIRLKKTKLFDGQDSLIRNYNYNQFTDSHKSSGVLNGENRFRSHYTVAIPKSKAYMNPKTAYQIIHTNNPGWQINTVFGKSITYSNVTEVFINSKNQDQNFLKQSTFSNSPCQIQFDPNSYINFNYPICQNTSLNSKLLSEKLFDNLGNPILKKDFDYNINFDLNKNSTNYSVDNRTSLEYGVDLVLISEGNSSLFGTSKYAYSLFPISNSWIQNKKTTTTEYFPTGEVVTTVENNYSPTYKHLYPTNTITTNSKGETLMTEYQYPPDLATGGNTVWDKMVERNMIGMPVRTKTSNDGTVLSEQRTVYNNFGELILPQFVYAKKGEMGQTEAVADRKITYNSYDAQGNLTQYTMENGIPVSIIWGYNGQYPIAKIEGKAYSSISSHAEVLIAASNSISGLNVNSFNALRSSFPDALITGYIYQPLVGVTMIIQPNGQSEHYKYDAAGRLEEVRNHHGEIIKSFEYNYARP